jgi:ribonuclease P protein subunit POP4
MRIAPSLSQHEFIGLKVEVVRSSNPSQVGIKGTVIDETQKTLKILQNGKEKVIMKEASTFHFTLPDKSKIEVEGKILVGRPEDRVKKAVRRRW